MQELLTVASGGKSGDIRLKDGPTCRKETYTDDEITRFKEKAALWELQAAYDIHFMLPADWIDDRVFIMDATNDMFVIKDNELIGLYYDSCFFELDSPESRPICNENPDYRNIGANFYGSVTYSLRPRPDDAALYSDDGSILVSCPKTYKGVFNIPKRVTKIGLGAFYKCAFVTEIHISSGVSVIEKHAFDCCTSLEKLSVEGESRRFGPFSFDGITTPITLIVPENAGYRYIDTMIKEYEVSQSHAEYASVCGSILSKDLTAFVKYPCKSKAEEYTVPESVCELTENCFAFCDGLQRIILTPNVKTIDANAFYYCSNLESLTVPSGFGIIKRECAGYCRKLKTLRVYKKRREE